MKKKKKGFLEGDDSETAYARYSMWKLKMLLIIYGPVLLILYILLVYFKYFAKL